MWQRLYEELSETNFLPIAVAFDARGPEAARQWIEAANPTYPCLIDEKHEVARLYNMVNVPMATWINENGVIVRPTETAATSDGFRSMDRKTGQMDPEKRAETAARRREYADALRDWAENGEKSRFIMDAKTAANRTKELTPEQAQGNAWFRLGEELQAQGNESRAQAAFAEARRLRPESWAFARQAWNLEEVTKAGGPEFWAAVEALGDKPYYEPFQL